MYVTPTLYSEKLLSFVCLTFTATHNHIHHNQSLNSSFKLQQFHYFNIPKTITIYINSILPYTYQLRKPNPNHHSPKLYIASKKLQFPLISEFTYRHAYRFNFPFETTPLLELETWRFYVEWGWRGKAPARGSEDTLCLFRRGGDASSAAAAGGVSSLESGTPLCPASCTRPALPRPAPCC